jgi:hypothetical protein
VYQLKGLRSALDLDSNELLLVLGSDAHGAHQIVVRVFGDERSHRGRLHVSKAPMP